MMIQKMKGGLEPRLKTPLIFKYTSSEKRKTWIKNMYPYSDIFLNSVREIAWNKYNYDGTCEYMNYDTGKGINKKCKSISEASFYFLGGCVYELLNKRYKRPNLYSYCDPTADIDVSVFPPKLTYYSDADVYFFNEKREINSFYQHFIDWLFGQLYQNINGYASHLDEMFPSMVDFNINEYEDIPVDNKTKKKGYKAMKVGKLYIVSFINEDESMFKIQVVCKIEDIIDHILELIVPLPESDIEFSPSSDTYNKPETTILRFRDSNHSTYPVQKFNSLVKDNISAYKERSLESSNKHKSINHVARLFYLYELFYQNRSLLTKNINLLFSDIPQFKYYKVDEHNHFQALEISAEAFLNAYIELIKQNKYTYDIFIRKNPTFFKANLQNHDNFIQSLSIPPDQKKATKPSSPPKPSQPKAIPPSPPSPPSPKPPKTETKPKECPAGKELNPKTNRCITIKKKIKKECPAGKELNPKTNRCITIKKKIKKECPPGKEINPKTNRCRKIK